MTAAANARVPANRWADFVAWCRHLTRPARRRITRGWTYGRIGAVCAAGLVVMVLSAFYLDARAIIWARTLPEDVVSFFNFVTDFGKSGWWLWPLGILLVLIGLIAPRLRRRGELVLTIIAVRVMFLFCAIALPGLFTNIVKGLIGRARPFVTGVADPFVFNPFVWHAPYASMPSGHGTTALSVVVAFGALWPQLRWLLWIYALLICVSRVIITAHHPSDVVGGALVGAIGALWVRDYFAARNLGLFVGPDGAVHPLPMPSWRTIKNTA